MYIHVQCCGLHDFSQCESKDAKGQSPIVLFWLTTLFQAVGRRNEIEMNQNLGGRKMDLLLG